MNRIGLAFCAALTCAPPVAAVAQEAGAQAGAQAVAIVGGGGGGDTQTLRTNPDAVAAPAMTTAGSCYVGDGSVAVGSYLFGGVSGTRNILDEGCEARADAQAFVGIAYAYAELLSDTAAARRSLALAERRMAADRADFSGAWPNLAQPWAALEWNP